MMRERRLERVRVVERHAVLGQRMIFRTLLDFPLCGSEMTKRFDWDQAKEARNAQKHGVTFGEARTVFADDLAGIAPDPDHSSPGEQRELIAGQSSRSRLLLVSFVEHGEVVKIISARLLTRFERRLYEEEKFP